eukprot:6492203-Amphidinium_carterae.1
MAVEMHQNKNLMLCALSGGGFMIQNKGDKDYTFEKHAAVCMFGSGKQVQTHPVGVRADRGHGHHVSHPWPRGYMLMRSDVVIFNQKACTISSLIEAEKRSDPLHAAICYHELTEKPTQSNPGNFTVTQKHKFLPKQGHLSHGEGREKQGRCEQLWQRLLYEAVGFSSILNWRAHDFTTFAL